MDRGAHLLQGLRTKLKTWVPFMQRATKGTVEFISRADGEFAVAVRWKNRDGSDGEFIREFTKKYCLGVTFTLPSGSWAVEKKACDYARDVVRDVLGARGVL